jgi:hypothetical protein
MLHDFGSLSSIVARLLRHAPLLTGMYLLEMVEENLVR